MAHSAERSPKTTARFQDTNWTMILAAGQSSARTEEALEKLCRTYWFPLYAYIRRQGYPPHDAEDVTQDFFATLLARRDLTQVHPSKGKFRTYLLACLQNFLANDRRKRQTLKRGGGRLVVPLDQAELEESLVADLRSGMSAQRLYDRRFAAAVLDQAMAELRLEMATEDKGKVFEELRVFLTDPGGPNPYEAAAARLGMTTGAVSTSVHRLRRRYRELVRATLKQTVTTPVELEEELNYLLEVCG